MCRVEEPERSHTLQSWLVLKYTKLLILILYHLMVHSHWLLKLWIVPPPPAHVGFNMHGPWFHIILCMEFESMLHKIILMGLTWLLFFWCKFSYNIKRLIGTRWLANPNQGYSYFPHYFEARMKILFIIKVKFACSLNAHKGHRLSPNDVDYELWKWASNFEHTFQSLSNTSVFYLILETHLTTYNSNIGVIMKKVNE